MNILHTSDWHLGQRFINQDRYEEHRAALKWLQNTIVAHKIDVLLIAGDIFDTANPPHEARKMYYQFLASLVGTSCRHVVVTGGNHDSPLMLNASRELLELLNIWVIGEATNPISDEIIRLKNDAGDTELIVAAVPFLRERDLRNAVAGESHNDRIAAIRTGIAAHYDSLAAIISEENNKPNEQKKPVVAMGHLYVTSAEDSKEQGSKIYMGNLDNLDAENFSNIFDYVALGHIHRPQILQNAATTVCYSGSIIPLSFTETRDTKSVTILTFEGCHLKEKSIVEIPTFRKLRRLKGTMSTLKTELENLKPAQVDIADSWVEIVIETDAVLLNPFQELADFCHHLPVEILKCRVENTGEIHTLDAALANKNAMLAELDVNEVFQKKLDATNLNADEKLLIKQAFLEIQ